VCASSYYYPKMNHGMGLNRILSVSRALENYFPSHNQIDAHRILSLFGARGVIMSIYNVTATTTRFPSGAPWWSVLRPAHSSRDSQPRTLPSGGSQFWALCPGLEVAISAHGTRWIGALDRTRALNQRWAHRVQIGRVEHHSIKSSRG